MEKLIFEPQDTLFFRDGRPFNQGENNDGIESLFPPSPLTLVGAARVAWARNLGWGGKGKWINTIGTDLGGDGEELTGLRFCGPLLHLGQEPLFPVPASFVGKMTEERQPEQVVRLRPGDGPMQCDLGEVRLPVPDVDESDRAEGRKLLEGWWLNRPGFARVLQGGVPERGELIYRKRLWCDELKVGNQIDTESGVTVEGMLYTIRHIRPNRDVRLIMGIEGNLKGFPEACQVPLGGEARSCWLCKEPGGMGLPDAEVSEKDGVVHYALYLLTPMNPSHPPEPGKQFEELPGTVVSACLPRPQRLGGWDTTKYEPLPMQPHLPPGSVIFMQADKSRKTDVLELHGKNIGKRSSWGFGLIAIGHWN